MVDQRNASGRQAPEASSSAPEGAPAPAKVLVIDDEEIIRRSLKRILERQGHDVDGATSAQDGMDKMVSHTYDLVLSDLMMPEMNGIQLLEAMAKLDSRPPVIMITGYPTIRTAVQALRLGAVDYLAKPFTRDEILGPVNRTLRREALTARTDKAGGISDSDVEGPSVEPSSQHEQGIEAPKVSISPGIKLHLPEHAWAEYQQDGTFLIGLESSFLQAVGQVASLRLPDDGQVLEQGHVFVRLETRGKENHRAFVPLSGRVLGLHRAAVESPGDVHAETWLIRILPTALENELELLRQG